jgi:hypothetical protein
MNTAPSHQLPVFGSIRFKQFHALQKVLFGIIPPSFVFLILYYELKKKILANCPIAPMASRWLYSKPKTSISLLSVLCCSIFCGNLWNTSFSTKYHFNNYIKFTRPFRSPWNARQDEASNFCFANLQ